MMEDRKIKILEAIIRDYVVTGEPVGSRTIAKKYDLGVSSATIRNEMADLEELGYLQQLHSSSGRIPSDLGYRLYVDKLMQLTKLTDEEKFLIQNKLIDRAIYELDKVVNEATRILTSLTDMVCIVKTPSLKKSTIKQIQLISIDRNTILVVIITDSGLIKNDIIRTQKPIESHILLKLNNLVNLRLSNLSIEDMDLEVINNLKNDLTGHDDIFNALIPTLYSTLKNMESSKVYAEGTVNILNYQEYSDIEKAKEFFEFVNNEENLRRLLNLDDKSKKIRINIGMENNLQQAKEYSIITAFYGFKDKPLGTIGVIGPTRMNYDRVISSIISLVEELNINILKIYK